MAYRFVDAGKLRTSNEFNDVITGEIGTITPLDAKHVYLNEFVASIAYHFDYM